MDTKEAVKAMGQRISYRRKQVGLTQEELAEKMDVSVQMISNLERGQKVIRADNLMSLIKILNVSSDYILTGKTTEKEINELYNKILKLSPEDFRMIEMIVEYKSK